jgi:hypothetical protein
VSVITTSEEEAGCLGQGTPLRVSILLLRSLSWTWFLTRKTGATLGSRLKPAVEVAALCCKLLVM